MARIRIVALHFKENTQKAQATTHEGHQCFVKVYPKAKEETEAVVQPRSLEPTFDYVHLVKQAVMERRKNECSNYYVAATDVDVINSTIPTKLTASLTELNKKTLFRDIEEQADNVTHTFDISL